MHGDFKNRFFYTLGGSLEHYSLFGTQTSPRAGLSLLCSASAQGHLQRTRILFNFGDAVREPALTDQFYSLYKFLSTANSAAIHRCSSCTSRRLAAPTTRTYEGGVEQAFFGQRLVFRTSFFHNEFGRQIEYVGLDLIPQLLPGLTPAQQNQLEQLLQANGAYELSLNTEAYRALGRRNDVESGIGRNIFLRGGYTYLDAVVQRSFTNDDVALLGPIPTYNGIPMASRLERTRPCRARVHSAVRRTRASSPPLTRTKRSDRGVDFGLCQPRRTIPTFLACDDINGGNSLLLPNRNLDHGYAKLDLGASYELLRGWAFTARRRTSPTTSTLRPSAFESSSPLTIRGGLRIQWGIGAGK